MSEQSRLRILVTNDDGIDSPGIHDLASAVAAACDVVVAAPAREASGSSASITAVATTGRIAERQHMPDADVLAWYAVDATPAFITLMALHGTFGPPPDVVLSGTNRGANAGHAVLHSGTVGAALTACAAGRRAMAVSLDLRDNPDVATAHREESRYWSSASSVAAFLLPALLDLPPGTVLNVNVPDLPTDRIGGIRVARLGGFGRVQIMETVPDGLLRISLEDPAVVPHGSDMALLAQDFATVTALRPVSDAGLTVPTEGWPNRAASVAGPATDRTAPA